MVKIRWFFIVASMVCAPLHAQIYKIVMPDGSIVYTDTPPENVEAEEVDLPDIVIQPATQVRDRTRQSQGEDRSTAEAEPVSLPTPQITQPSEQQVVPPGQRQVTIVAQVDSELPSGYHFMLLLNGRQEGSLADNPVWTVNNPNPGEQRAQVAIVDAGGNRRVVSETRIFYVIR